MAQAVAPREEGFYWVQLGPNWKTHGAWVVAELDSRGWQVMDEPRHYGDAEFDTIMPQRLKAPYEVC